MFLADVADVAPGWIGVAMAAIAGIGTIANTVVATRERVKRLEFDKELQRARDKADSADEKLKETNAKLADCQQRHDAAEKKMETLRSEGEVQARQLYQQAIELTLLRERMGQMDRRAITAPPPVPVPPPAVVNVVNNPLPPPPGTTVEVSDPPQAELPKPPPVPRQYGGW